MAQLFSSINFIKNPLEDIITFGLKKELSPEFFEVIFQELIDYFKNVKRYRTIDHAKEILMDIKEKYDHNLESLLEKDPQDFLQEIEKSSTNFIEKNKEHINNLARNEKTKEIFSYWIFNYDIIIKSLKNAIKKEIKRQIMYRRNSRFRMSRINTNLESVCYAIFLPLFRIMEQIQMIINGEEMDIDEEIECLIEDVVYMKNVIRKYKIY